MDMQSTILEKKTPINRKTFSTVRTMIIDEDKEQNTYLTASLRRLGVCYQIEDNLGEVMKTLQDSYKKKEGYEICFVNRSMKNDTGALVVQKIREKYDEKTIFLVGYGCEECSDEHEMFSEGINHVINRPMLHGEIYHFMSEFCKEISRTIEN